MMYWKIHIKTHFRYILLMLAVSHFFAIGFAQSPKKSDAYEGVWYNGSNKRQLTISYDEANNRYTINDYTKGYSEDAYYAYPKDGKLMTPAENGHHHASYCEIFMAGNKLVYECNSSHNFTDNFMNRKEDGSKMVFVRKKNRAVFAK